jgi:hypothetical protein
MVAKYFSIRALVAGTSMLPTIVRVALLGT